MSVKTLEPTLNKPQIKTLQKFWPLVVLTLLTLLAAVLRLYKLDVPSFEKGNDEGWTVINSSYPLAQIVPHLWPDHTPLYFFFSHFYLDLTSHTHDKVILRLPAVLAGTLIIPVTYGLAREILTKKAIALVAAFGAAIVPLLVDLSRYFRMYALFALLSVAAAYFLLRALRTNQKLDWAGFVVMSALNLYTHYDSVLALILPLGFAVVWFVLNLAANFDFSRVKNTPTWLVRLCKAATPLRFATKSLWLRSLALLISLAAIGLLYLPWLSHFLYFSSASGYGVDRGFYKVTLDWKTLYSFVSQTTFGEGLGFYIGLPLSLVGLGWLFYKRFFYGLFCFCYYWGMLLVILNAPKTSSSNLLVSPRYYCFITPIYLIMLAQGLDVLTFWLKTLWQPLKFNKRFGWAALAPAILLLALISYAARQEYQQQQIYQVQPSYLDTATRFLQQNLQPGDVVLTAAPEFASTIFKRNYLISQTLAYLMTPNDAAQYGAWSHFMEFEQLDSYANLQNLKSSHARFWLLVVQDNPDAQTTQKLQALNNSQFRVQCFNPICLVSVNPNTATLHNNQLQDLELLMQNFGFLNADFASELQKLDVYANLNLQPAFTNPQVLTLSGQPVTEILPLTTSAQSQYYYVQFQYRGDPARILVNLQDAAGKTIASLPAPYGYTPNGYTPTPTEPHGSWHTDGLLVKVPAYTTEAVLTLFGTDGPAQIQNVQLFASPASSR